VQSDSPSAAPVGVALARHPCGDLRAALQPRFAQQREVSTTTPPTRPSPASPQSDDLRTKVGAAIEQISVATS